MALKEVIKRVLNDESLEPEERDTLVSWFLSDKGKEDFYEVLQEYSEKRQEDGHLNYNTLLQKIHDKKEFASICGRSLQLLPSY